LRKQSESAPSDVDCERFAVEAQTEELYSEDFRGISIRYANVTFTDTMSLLDEEAPIEILFLGKSYTDGDAVVWLPRQKVLVAGDAVVSPIPYWRTSYPVEWIEVLERIKAFGYTVLIPGHGVPETNTTYIDNLIATLKNLNGQVAALANKRLSLDETQADMDLPSLMKTLGGAGLGSFGQVSPDWAPVVACSYAEAKHSPILQGTPCASLKQ
jgi:glyoxylase-like metal-dependent hydrolase (beta-lactamase superfamily II)